mmetsp:Transcript_29472/g.67900  ORF Transcript_29472/g.67900 Transcript_29472/m.67900 type:complete len:248 (-) Transcript_29472:186-929(-)
MAVVRCSVRVPSNLHSILKAFHSRVAEVAVAARAASCCDSSVQTHSRSQWPSSKGGGFRRSASFLKGSRSAAASVIVTKLCRDLKVVLAGFAVNNNGYDPLHGRAERCRLWRFNSDANFAGAEGYQAGSDVRDHGREHACPVPRDCAGPCVRHCHRTLDPFAASSSWHHLLPVSLRLRYHKDACRCCHLSVQPLLGVWLVADTCLPSRGLPNRAACNSHRRKLSSGINPDVLRPFDCCQHFGSASTG